MAIQNTFYLDVDIKRDNYVEEPQVTQNDDIAFVLRLTDDGVDMPIAGVSTYTLASLRADGQSVLTVGTLTGHNEVTFELGSTEVSVPGRVKAAIQLYDVDGRVSSIPFTYEVTKDLATNYVPSKDEQTLIELVLGEGPVILAEARQATADAIQATSDLTALKTEVVDATANANTSANHAATEGNRASTQADRADTAATNAEGVYNAILPVLPNIEGWGYDPIPYDPTTTYEKNNIVGHEGSTYISLLDGNVGNTPTLATPNVNWGVLARRGIDGKGAVSSVNGVGPDASGDVTITIPDPDLSGLATKAELQTLDDEKADKVMINVADFGAMGDGSNDDTQAFNDAIAACKVGDTLLVPNPIKSYKISSTIVLSKPIKIVGSHAIYEVQGGFETTCLLEFDSSVKTGIRIDSYGVTLKGLSIKLNSTTADTVACIHLYGLVDGAMRHINIQDIETYVPGIYGAGIKGSGVLLTYIDNVHTNQGAYGFHFDGYLNTSINFHNAWAKNFLKSGYLLDNVIYSSFVNSCADSVNSPEYGYSFKNSKAISMYTCASEHAKNANILIDNSKTVTIVGMFGGFGNNNGSGTARASFCEIINGSKQINITGSEHHLGENLNTASIYVDSTSFVPVIISSYMPAGLNNNGTLSSPISPSQRNSEINIGLGTFTDNPLGIGGTLFDGRPFLGTKAKRLGVLNESLTEWKGAINGDGSFYVGGYENALPPASSNLRGTIIRKIGTSGTADELYMCIKTTTGGYEWRKVNLV